MFQVAKDNGYAYAWNNYKYEMLGLKGHKGQIHDGPISWSLHNDLLTHIPNFMLLSPVHNSY